MGSAGRLVDTVPSAVCRQTFQWEGGQDHSQASNQQARTHHIEGQWDLAIADRPFDAHPGKATERPRDARQVPNVYGFVQVMHQRGQALHLKQTFFFLVCSYTVTWRNQDQAAHPKQYRNFAHSLRIKYPN
jgi:hypothetical protein